MFSTNIQNPYRISIGVIAWMLVLACIVTAGGIYYAISKNEQVALNTNIKNIRRDIATCNMSRNQHLAKTHALCNRWAMLDRLNQDGSELRPIQREQIEIAQHYRLKQQATAQR